MSKLIKNILIGAIAIFLLYGAYTLFSGDNGSDDQLLSSEKIKEVDSVDKSLLSLLLELRSIELDDSIFNSSAFQVLYDFGIEIEAQPVGRDNPFSPLENNSVQEE